MTPIAVGGSNSAIPKSNNPLLYGLKPSISFHGTID
jgi:hypothetical protein